MKKQSLLAAASLVLGTTAIGFAQAPLQIQMGPGDQCGPLASVACNADTAGLVTANIFDNTVAAPLEPVVQPMVGFAEQADQSAVQTEYSAFRTEYCLEGSVGIPEGPTIGCLVAHVVCGGLGGGVYNKLLCALALLNCPVPTVPTVPTVTAVLDCPTPTVSVPSAPGAPGVPAVPATVSSCVISGGCPHGPIPKGNGVAGCIGAPGGAVGCVCVDGNCMWDGAYASCDEAAAAACTSCVRGGVCQ